MSQAGLGPHRERHQLDDGDTASEEVLANAGLMLFNPPVPDGGPRTFIISGVARGGTSLLAKLFVMADVPMGSSADPVVFEDREVADALEQRDRTALLALIKRRNTEHAVWGFKRPNLFARLPVSEIDHFRNPSLVLVFRDPVAIAQRNVISNRSFATNSLQDAIDNLAKLVSFARQACCPALLVSYEKALALPGRLVDALGMFAGWSISDSRRARMVEAATTNNSIYWRTTRVQLKGFVDRVSDGRLHGWCHVLGSGEPVHLEVLIDGKVIGDCRADVYRGDLAKAGIGLGRHAFSVDITRFIRDEESTVAVQVKNRDFLLANSGATVRELKAKGG
jgi:hypothetical protein